MSDAMSDLTERLLNPVYCVWACPEAHSPHEPLSPNFEAMQRERVEAANEIERLRALIVLGDFTNLRPNSDSFKLVQQIRREQSTGEQGLNNVKD